MLPSTDRASMNRRMRRPSLAAEYWGFLRQTAKWWLIPIVVITLGLGLLVLLGTTGAAPFIYTLF